MTRRVSPADGHGPEDGPSELPDSDGLETGAPSALATGSSPESGMGQEPSRVSRRVGRGDPRAALDEAVSGTPNRGLLATRKPPPIVVPPASERQPLAGTSSPTDSSRVGRETDGPASVTAGRSDSSPTSWRVPGNASGGAHYDGYAVLPEPAGRGGPQRRASSQNGPSAEIRPSGPVGPTRGGRDPESGAVRGTGRRKSPVRIADQPGPGRQRVSIYLPQEVLDLLDDQLRGPEPRSRTDAAMEALIYTWEGIVQEFPARLVHDPSGRFPARRVVGRRRGVVQPRMVDLYLSAAEADALAETAEQTRLSVSALFTHAVKRHYGDEAAAPRVGNPGRVGP
jgi:hypothetical protein